MASEEIREPGVLYDATTGRILCSVTRWQGISVGDGQALLKGVEATEGQMVDVSASPPVLTDAPPPVVDLAVEKKAARFLVKAAANNMRSFFLSSGDAKAWSLAVKGPRAVDYLRRLEAGETVPESEYPGLLQEVGSSSGASLFEVAQTIRARFLACEAQDGAITKVELDTCAAIDSATTQGEIDQLIDTLVWPTP